MSDSSGKIWPLDRMDQWDSSMDLLDEVFNNFLLDKISVPIVFFPLSN